MESIVKELYYNELNDFYNDVISPKGLLYNGFSTSYKNQVIRSFIFRGVSCADFNLLPTALRTENKQKVWELGELDVNAKYSEYNQIQAEEKILNKFLLKCDYHGLTIPKVERLRVHFRDRFSIDKLRNANKWLSDEYFELAGLAQHYGLPTRLLDWTKDFYVALYFALKRSDINLKNEHVAVWAFDYSTYQIFNFERVNDPLRFIQPEYYLNPNLGAQKGLFTLWQIDSLTMMDHQIIDITPLNQLVETRLQSDSNEIPTIFYKIMIHKKLINELSIFLRKSNYDAARLFPGYYGVVRSIEEAT
ncbi:MAG: FRG domain-containing protein [Paludibacter sp.]|nr:FRG domain-containing protein [Paludibacter sp.]